MAEYIKMIAVAMRLVPRSSGRVPAVHLWTRFPGSGPLYLFIKVAIWLFVLIWIRATMPRIRYDKLMALGWKVMFPLALLSVLVTAIVVVLIA